MDYLRSLVVWFYDGIVNILTALVKPLTDFVMDTLYFFAKFFDVVVWVLKVILALLKLFGSTVVGIFATIGNFLSYSGSVSYDTGKYATGFNKLITLGNTVGLGIIPTIISFVIVIISGITLLKIIRTE